MEYTQEDLIKMNMIKDRRRRYVYLIKGKQEGYHIMERDMKAMNLISGRNLWGLFVFVILFGLLKQSFLISLLTSLIVFAAFIIFEKFFFLKKKNILKVSDQDYAYLTSLPALRALKSENMSYAIMPLLVILIIFTRSMDKNATFSQLDTVLMNITLLVFASMTAYFTVKYFRIRKQIKQLEKK